MDYNLFKNSNRNFIRFKLKKYLLRFDDGGPTGSG
jgi:hypothetical protein